MMPADVAIQAELQSLQRAPIAGARFSIVIPTWNNLPYLKLCVESIRKYSAHRHQIIVHVNEGKDGSVEWVRQQADLDYSISRVNIGICYALNACRKLLTTDYLLYMNDDMVVCPDWDAPLWQAVQKIPHKFFFLSATATEPVAQSRCSIEQDYGHDAETFDQARLLREFAALPFADWQGATWPPNLVHKDVWDLVGGYSTEFSPGMYSDPDFSMKLWQLGVRHFQGVSASRVYHFGSKSVKRIVKNPGYFVFIAKWGMPSSVLTKTVLRRGEPFDGPLKPPRFSWAIKLKAWAKRLNAALRRRLSI